MSQTQDWIKEKFKEENELGVNVEYSNMRLTRELLEIKQAIKMLQIDIAWIMKKYEND